MRIALGTVAYRQNQKFTRDFVESINNAKNLNELIVVNDNLENTEINYLKNEILIKTNFIKPHSEIRSIPQLRALLLKEAKKNGVDLLVLADFDDTFSINRVKQIEIEYDDSYSFFYNEVVLMESGKPFITDLPKTVFSIEQIAESNFLGLSNTAINLSKVDQNVFELLEECQSKIFDWYLFSIIISLGGKGKLIENVATHYRIHQSNTAGVTQISKDAYLNELRIKIDHYSALVSKKILPYAYLDAIKHIYCHRDVIYEKHVKDKQNQFNRWWQLISTKEISNEH
jgi:hypothetical protein